MTTFVLVHGAWHGGWCWRRVRDALAPSGAAVYTPTLTGLGERAHLLSRRTDLETHVRDVLGVLASEDLDDVVLVGHSYAGVVASAVADRAAERVARLVYLDAVVPSDGESLFDHAPAHVRSRLEEHARAAGDGWRVPPEAMKPEHLGLREDDDLRWVVPRLTPHPLRTLREPVRLSSGFPAVPRSYVNCIGGKSPGQPRPAYAESIDDYHELATGHDAMVTAAAELTGLLRRIAGERASPGDGEAR